MTREQKRRTFLGASALVVAGVVVLAREVMLPIILGIVVAYVILPIVRRLEARNVPRALAIILTYVVILGSLAIFVRMTAHRIAAELGNFAREMPALVTQARERWIPSVEQRIRAVRGMHPQGAAHPADEDSDEAFVVRPHPDGSFGVEVEDGLHVRRSKDGFVINTRAAAEEQPFDADKFLNESVEQSLDYARTNVVELARLGGGVLAAVSRVILIFGLTLMIGAYLIITKEKIGEFLLSLARPAERPDLKALAIRMDHGLSGVVRGQLVICLINGALSAIGFALLGLRYWPLLAIVALIFSLVPIFGALASAIPAVALGLTQGLSTAIFVLIWIVAIHQLEANFLNPKIMGDSAKIHPVLVIFALLVGEHFFHVIGALLAVPCMSIAQSIFLWLREIFDRNDPNFTADIADPPGTR